MFVKKDDIFSSLSIALHVFWERKDIYGPSKNGKMTAKMSYRVYVMSDVEGGIR